MHSTMINTVLLAAAMAVAASPVGLAAQDGETAPCPRASGILVERGAIQDVTNEPPCRLVFRRTGVRLTASPDGSRPDPGRLVVKDGRGRYYSTNADGWESTISVWSTDGAYLTSFGGAGEGPGEFRDESLALFVDAGDSLHVLDSRDWSVFTPEHEFARQVPARQMGSANLLDEQETFFLYYDGRILASSPHPSTDSSYFRIVNRDGSLDRTFGTSDEGTGAGGHYGHDRAMAYSAGYKYFWAAPSLEGADEYVLEEWDVTGAEGLPAEARRPGIVRSLRRHQPWFKWTGNRNGSPAVRSLHITLDELLVVQVWRPTEEYAEAMERYDEIMREGGTGWTPELDREMGALVAELTHAVVEVIDVRSAQLLASHAYPVGEVMRGDALLPMRFFRNEMTGYVYGIGGDGLPYVEIVEGVLEKK